MPRAEKLIPILIADDDADDCEWAEKALRKSRLLNPVYFVKDGEELMDYLYHRGAYKDHAASPRPGMILLDLNMPKKDGREALTEIRADTDLRQIPVVVLTTSQAEEDVFRSYDSGANSFITKPVTFEGLVVVMKSLTQYWFEIVELPDGIVGS